MKKSIKVLIAGMLAVPVLAFGTVLVAPAPQSVFAQGSIQDGAAAAKSDDQSGTLFGDEGVFKVITNAALYIIGAVSVLMLIYGGVRYTISMGDEKNVVAAKNTILYAIVGIIVALLAYAIVNFVLDSLIAK